VLRAKKMKVLGGGFSAEGDGLDMVNLQEVI